MLLDAASRLWTVWPTEFPASGAERHPYEFFPKSFCFDRIRGLLKLLRQFKERRATPVICGDTIFDQVEYHAIGSDMPLVRYRLNPGGEFTWNGDTPSRGFRDWKYC
jgi:hypothetical protein